jgi:hypothetical protein
MALVCALMLQSTPEFYQSLESGGLAGVRDPAGSTALRYSLRMRWTDLMLISLSAPTGKNN